MYQNITANKRKSIFLIVAFLVVVVALGFAVEQYYPSGGFIPVMALVMALVSTATSWWAGDKIALATSGAVPVGEQDDPELYRLVENLAITAGLPMPKVYVIPEASLNAFATGRDPQHASIAVTAGLRQALTKTELEGVLAHELSHVGNYDTRFIMLTALLVGFVALLADFFLRSQLWGGRRSERNGNAVVLIVGLVLAILSPLIAQLIQFAISRRREFLADASGALLTRYPEGLASALQKIATQQQPLPEANTATAPMYFTNPFEGVGRRVARLFSTHPPIEERIKALTTMSL